MNKFAAALAIACLCAGVGAAALAQPTRPSGPRPTTCASMRPVMLAEQHVVISGSSCHRVTRKLP